jgi:hypothetical protein
MPAEAELPARALQFCGAIPLGNITGETGHFIDA